jgi:fimbrial isopeptide formation D2 family protein/LPXTG-motif cell wall-anchored protein
MVLALMMVMAMASVAFASTLKINSTAPTATTETDTTAYKAWKLLNADLEEAPTTTAGTGAQEGGKVAYYTTSSDVVSALGSLFDFVQVGDTDKWYATAKESFTDASAVTTLLATKTEDELTALFGEPATGAQTTPGGSAEITVDDGYYYITSTLGDKIAVLTVGDTEINTKNSYPTEEKELKTPTTDANVQIGDDVTYTLTVNIPDSANDVIVLTDVMDDGLTFKSIDDTFSDSVAYTFAPEAKTAAAVTANSNTFTLTIAADVVKANQGKTITIDYVATVNKNAEVGVPEVNKVTLKYGNNYESKPEEAETVTHKFTFDKVDGSTKLTGAEFILTTDGSTPIDLVQITAGEEYRIWMSEDGEAAKIAGGTIVTTGKTITIDGVDSDVTYKLVETKAPAGGYNLKTEPTDVTPSADDDSVVHIDVENNKGSVLPSTGGIGTTIFYVAGIVLVLGAVAVLVARRKAEQE